MQTIEKIYQGLMARFQELTGVTPMGEGDLAVRFYAVAAELYSLYVQGEWVRAQCFPQSAVGESLERHAALRGVTRRAAEHAEGVIRFYLDEVREESIPVEKGTVCLTAEERRFETVEEGIIQAGTLYVDVPARAVAAGEAGNAAPGTILSMVVAPAAVSSCINPEAFAGGRDEEGDDALRQRVLETYARLANGANAAYYKQMALSFGAVASAQVVPRSRGVGTVDVVVAVQSGVPEQELLDEIKAHIQSMREIAVDVEVLSPEEVTVDMELSIEVEKGYDAAEVSGLAEESLRGWFTGERLGENVLRARLTSLIFGLDGVANCTVIRPEEDVAIGATQLPALGTLTVSTR